MEAFKAAHIEVENNILSQSPIGPLALGVRVTDTDNASVSALLMALGPEGAGFAVSPEPVPQGAGFSTGGAVPVPATVFVGAKPPKP